VIGVALKGLLGRKLRSVLTAFAIVLGVAMVSGSFVFTDTIEASFDKVFDDLYSEAAVVLSPRPVAAVDEAEDEPPAFDASLLGRVRRIAGVENAVGSVFGTFRLVGEDGKPLGREGVGVSVDRAGDQRLNPLELVEGRWPEGGGEVAIDESTAKKQGLGVGDTIAAFADGPVRRYRISALVRFGSLGNIAGTTLAALDLPVAQRLFDKVGKLDEIQVAASAGVPQAELARRVQAVLPATAEAKTASAQAAEESQDLSNELATFRYVLLAFGAIALFVGSFVIANTLAITVAQRTRELATLRTLGGSRRQVLASVLLEALVIGLLASIAGLLLGLGIAHALRSLFAALDLELPGGGLVFATRTVVVSVAAGTLVALLASLRPALRATRVEPIAAVREGALLPTSRLARRGSIAASAVLAVASAMLGYGLLADGAPLRLRLLALGTGVLVLFLGVALAAPRLVRPLAAVLGAPAARLSIAGALARANTVRNPARTATTAAALMIGLALITFVAVIAQGARASLVDAVEKQFLGDYALAARSEDLGDAALRAARSAPGAETVSGVREGSGRLSGESVLVTSVDAAITKVVSIDWTRGSDRVPAQLGRDGAFVQESYAEQHDLDVGSQLRLTTATGTTIRLTVDGIFRQPRGGSPFGAVTISRATFDRSFTNRDNAYAFANMRGGVTPKNTRRLEQALAAFPDVDVQTRDEFTAAQLEDLEATLNIVYALLALSVLVSVFGIVNTLVLSVFERTRELGMLRAIGMSRRQVRRMIRHESVVTTLIGATLGISVGLLLAAVFTRALADEGFVFAVPYASLLAFILVAIGLGLLAAILPARRASRLNVLHALQYGSAPIQKERDLVDTAHTPHATRNRSRRCRPRRNRRRGQRGSRRGDGTNCRLRAPATCPDRHPADRDHDPLPHRQVAPRSPRTEAGTAPARRSALVPRSESRRFTRRIHEPTNRIAARDGVPAAVRHVLVSDARGHWHADRARPPPAAAPLPRARDAAGVPCRARR
jgi:putative ABC transport system permease protein